MFEQKILFSLQLVGGNCEGQLVTSFNYEKNILIMIYECRNCNFLNEVDSKLLEHNCVLCYHKNYIKAPVIIKQPKSNWWRFNLKSDKSDSLRGYIAILVIGLVIWGAYEVCNYTTSKTQQVSRPPTEEEIQAENLSKTEIKRRDSIANKEYQEKVAAEYQNLDKTKAGRIRKKHPEWSMEDCERIAKNKIWIGMHIKMVAYIRGNPDSANPSDYGYGREWQWCWNDYSPSCFYGSDDGIVRAYN
ncbi:MAG: hypothetical protein QM530_05610 [Phycisphaerales bacterium]|nr:hypothetical protein [Phycisphaerales bacterium]